MTAEVRVTNADTGGAKGRKDCELGFLPADALRELGRVASHGARKYDDPYNFRKGYAITLSLNALWRHVLAFQGGETDDPDSGLPHLAHACWHTLNMMQTLKDHPQLDDRWQTAPPERTDAEDTTWLRDVYAQMQAEDKRMAALVDPGVGLTPDVLASERQLRSNQKLGGHYVPGVGWRPGSGPQ